MMLRLAAEAKRNPRPKSRLLTHGSLRIAIVKKRPRHESQGQKHDHAIETDIDAEMPELLPDQFNGREHAEDGQKQKAHGLVIGRLHP